MADYTYKPAIDLANLPTKKVGIEHEIKFAVPDSQTWTALTNDPQICEGVIINRMVATQSTIYFDTLSDDLLFSAMTLGMLVNPGWLAGIAWLVCKETIDWSGEIRHALEVAERVDPAAVQERMLKPGSTPVDRVRRLLNKPQAVFVPRLVAEQSRQKFLVRLSHGQLMGLSLDTIRFSRPETSEEQVTLRLFEVEVNSSDLESLDSLQGYAAHYQSQLGLKALSSQKYRLGVEGLEQASAIENGRPVC